MSPAHRLSEGEAAWQAQLSVAWMSVSISSLPSGLLWVTSGASSRAYFPQAGDTVHSLYCKQSDRGSRG